MPPGPSADPEERRGLVRAGSPISADDLVWIKVSDASRNMVSSGVLFFRGACDLELVRERVRAAFPSYPKLMSCPEPADGGWRWRARPEFDVLDNVDVRSLDASARHRGGRLHFDPALESLLHELVGEDLPAERPRWRLVIVDGLRYDGEPAFCLVLSTHHCVADGVAYYDILANLCRHPERGRHHVRRAPAARASWVRCGGENLEYFLAMLRPEPRTFLNQGEATGKWLAISTPHALTDLARVAKEHGVSVNALALAALAGAIAGQIRATSGAIPRRVRAVLPVSAHQRDESTSELVNRMGYFHIRLDLREDDPVLVAKGIDAEMRSFKTFGIDTMMQYVARLIGVLPAGLAKRLHRFFCSRASLVVSCFPFPRVPLTLGSAEAVNIGAFPVVPHPLGTSTMLVTHRGQLTLYARSNRTAGVAAALVEQFGRTLRALGAADARPELAAPAAPAE